MFKKILTITTIIASLFSASFHPTEASAKTIDADNFYFDNFEGDYYLYRDADGKSRMLVVEELTAVFPDYNQNQGIRRLIPYTHNDGKNLTIPNPNTFKINAKRNGKDEPINKIEQGFRELEVYIGEPGKYVTGEQTYTLTYEFENVTMDFDNFQELYWDTNGTGWLQSFKHLTARVHLADDIEQNFTGNTSCYVGNFGAKGEERCKTRVYSSDTTFPISNHSSHKIIEFTAQNSLSSWENLTYAIEFKPQTFAAATIHHDYTLYIGLGVAILLACGMIALMLAALLSTAQKRRYAKTLFVKPEYTPHPEYTVAEMTQNYFGGHSGKSKTATLIDLAVHHKIELIKTENPKYNPKSLFGGTQYLWKIRVKSADNLNPQQKSVLKILKHSRATIETGEEFTITAHTSSREMISEANEFDRDVENSLYKKGLCEVDSYGCSKQNPKWHNFPSILTACTIAWFVLGLFLITIGYNYEPNYGVLEGRDFVMPAGIILIAVIFILSLTVSIYTSKYAKHTFKGIEISKYMEGLKLYIKMAEAERLQFLQSVQGSDTTHEGIVKLYEKLLPYAMVFGLEKSWLNELSHYYEFDDVQPPSWYVGVGAFSTLDFVNAMNMASNTISSNIASSTTSSSSSSSSGGGGGGFSGGGGGGGGGGGW